jgi:pimeloyl-ACP methyl ester carboxylesterase
MMKTPAGFTVTSTRVNGVRLAYFLGGDPNGPPVILWHGFLGERRSWHKVMPALADAGLAVLVPDMRGYGDSDKPAGNVGYDGRALAEDFRALVRRIGFGAGRPIVLVAHDMGAPPALLWAADHPEEVRALTYIEAPVMLSEVLTKVFAYTPQAMSEGSMWWWILPLAPDVPERLIVGNERAFLTWFYERATAQPMAIDAKAVDEYVRTFSGREAVLGALGVYRTAFTTIDQTEPLTHRKVSVPVSTLAGDKSLGANVRDWVGLVAEHVDGRVIVDCGHFVPEERPEEIIRAILALTSGAHPSR